MKRKVFIVDDHPIMRRGYASLIRREGDLELSGEAGSAEEAIGRIDEDPPDIAIVDISLDGISGIELTKHLRSRFPSTAVLVVSMHDEALYAERAIAAGARGYIMKSEVDRTIIEAIRKILSGGYHLSESVSGVIFARLGERRRGGATGIEGLSDRELEVFESLGRGRSTAEIAEALVISIKTVETHRARIKEKLGLDSGRELLRHAMQWVEGRVRE